MIPCAVLEAVGSSRALRFCRTSASPSCLAPLPIRPSAVAMNTSSSPRLQLWQPSRGISFSLRATTPKPPAGNDHGARLLSQSAPALAAAQDNAAAAPDVQSVQNAGSSVSEEIQQMPSWGNELSTPGPIPDYPVLPTDLVEDGNLQGTPVANSAARDDESKAEAEAEAAAEAAAALDPPYAALDYKMPEELFRAAQSAAPGTPKSFWSYSLYRGPSGDGSPQKPRVHYCISKHTTERVCQQYFMNEKVLGFDLEWMMDANRSSGAKRNVSLIQLASPSRIALFHVALFAKNDDLVAPSFKKIMENPDITKVGVWINGDATKIRTYLGIESRGLMELSHLYKLVTHSRSGEFEKIDKRLVPLAVQVKECLHLPMFKGDVRTSDWSRRLDMEQVGYAGSDAYAGVHLYATLEHQRQQLDPCPPTPYHAELKRPIRLASGIDSESSSEEDTSDSPPEENAATTKTPSRATRRPQLAQVNALIKSVSKDLAAAKQTISEVEKSLAGPDPRVEAAEAWAAVFKAENQPSDPETQRNAGFAAMYELRAYHLWHTNKDLPPAAIAKLLRTPPLTTGTVVGYIWCAVRKEDLPVDSARYEKEIVQQLSGNLRWLAKKSPPRSS